MAASSGRFPAESRLRKSSDFRKVFESPARSTDSQFVVLARRNDKQFARLGLAISRQRQASAVARNRIKRLIRESFRRHRLKLAGLDIVVLSQKSTSTDDNKKLRRSLEQHWERIVRCGES